MRRDGLLTFEAPNARLTVSAAEGGRLASAVVGGRELLVTDRSAGPMGWGVYPMAPWAGRIRGGRFAFRGREHRLPIIQPPHAIHGVVYDVGWHVENERTISTELDGRWAFRGRVVQSFAIGDGCFEATIRLEADEPMPAVVGWHPWFRRRLADDGSPVELHFAATGMLRRDAEGIPTGERVPPPPGPWDDAFTGLAGPPALVWPDQLRLELSSTCAWWVIYDEPEHAVCVEPQSGPPDAANLSPEVVEPDRPLCHSMRWRWTELRQDPQ